MKAKTLLVIALVCFPACVYAQNGNSGLDPYFAKGGILIDTSYSSNSGVEDLKLRPDGKIIVLGSGDYGPYVARYTSDGRLDSSFGTNGSRWIESFAKPKDLYGGVCELQPDEKILVLGSTYEFIRHNVWGGFIMRLNPDGTIDSTFANNGVQYSGEQPKLLYLKPDGRIVTANEEVLVKCYKANGMVDSAFGINGLSQINSGDYPELSALGVLADGRIAVIGGSQGSIFYIRLLADGRRDSSFCGTGICYTPGALGRSDAIVYPNGETLVAVNWYVDDPPAITRLKADATPDSSFGVNGDGFFFIPVPGLVINKFLQSSDGRILCAGMLNEHFAVARILKDGKGMDTTFGEGGMITTSVSGGHYERIYAAALQQDGKILAGGICRVLESNPKYWHHVAAIVRYFSDAKLGVIEAPQSAKGKLKVFPNPASTSLIVALPAPGLLQLFSSEGRLLRQQFCVESVQGLEVASLPQGVYLLRLKTAYKRYTSLFVKE